jgi:hypothetical protein
MAPYYNCLEELQKWLREYGTATVMDDFQLLNPDLYLKLEEHFTKKHKSKEVAALLKKQYAG